MFEDFAYHFYVWFCITFFYYALSITYAVFIFGNIIFYICTKKKKNALEIH